MKEGSLNESWERPLVTVVVITYNSAKYVLDTLESAKAQTYQNIELIISDDCSQDETLIICENWLKENSDRFVRTELITTSKNTGTAVNVNRGIKAAHGVWIKFIAGDDVLFPQLVSQYVEYICENRNVEFMHSQVVYYKETFEEKNRLPEQDAKIYKINQKGLTPKDQFEILLRQFFIGTPTVMIKTSVFKKVGLFDERFPLWEDRPMFLKITAHNIKLEFLDIPGAMYRVRIDSVAHGGENKKLISNFKYIKSSAYTVLFLKHLSGREKYLKKILLKIEIFFYKNLNTTSFPIYQLYKLLVLPLQYVINITEKKYR